MERFISAVVLAVLVNLGSSSRQLFTFAPAKTSYFRDMLIDGSNVVVGARNAIYQLNVDSLSEKGKYPWTPESSTIDECRRTGGTEAMCHNYIRVLVRDNNNRLIACGTNAMDPKCHTLDMSNEGFTRVGSPSSGLALSPKTPDQLSTAVYAGNSIYSGGSVTDIDYLIYKSETRIRTEDADSRILNKPEFVSSFEEDDKVYFIFREPAVEYVNCGKRIYSRISRVCKKDKGGTINNQKRFMSFFKARMNCSIPGEFPFYFDEVQSMSSVSLGSFKALSSSSAAEKMFYAVFTTPHNSIRGSAICAYKWSDVLATFDGKFKEQKDGNGAWLPVLNSETPKPHPTKCVNNTVDLDYTTQQFNKRHPLMDQAVPAYGSRPIVMDTSLNRTFTNIVVDFQVQAADNHSYDVLFIGMNDGTVRKAYNRGRGSVIETVIVEDITVFSDGHPIENMKIHKKDGHVNIIVASKKEIKKFAASDCSAHKTCSKCVGSKDVYCSWNKKKEECQRSTRGLQNLVTGYHPQCKTDPLVTEPNTGPTTDTAAMTENRDSIPVTTVPVAMTTCTPCVPCSCPVAPPTDLQPKTNVTPSDDSSNKKPPANGDSNKDGVVKLGGVGASTANDNIYSASTLAIAAVVSILLSLFVGFIVGYRVSMCKNSQDIETPFTDRNVPLRKSQNTLESPQFTVNDSNSNTHNNKQLNMVVNLKPKSNTNLSNGNAETKPVAKVKKVYL